MRVDGKFYIGIDIPEGQGRVNTLLAECYNLVWELRTNVIDEEAQSQTFFLLDTHYSCLFAWGTVAAPRPTYLMSPKNKK